MATSTYLNSLITGSFGSAVATFSDPARMLPTSKRQATVVSVTADAVRSARLLLETPSPADSAVRALADGRVPPLPVRVAQRVAMKAGRITYERNVVSPLTKVRSEALGSAARGPPRLVARVDEFP